MALLYKIPTGRYKRLLNGYTYGVRDDKGKEKRVHVAGLGSKDKVIAYLNETEGLLGEITELAFMD